MKRFLLAIALLAVLAVSASSNVLIPTGGTGPPPPVQPTIHNGFVEQSLNSHGGTGGSNGTIFQ
jgi:hypothetical protein